jgi:pyridoxine 4-dehydrogenase
MVEAQSTPAAAAGTLELGGDLEVSRMGFGAMRITGEGIWGDPPDPEGAKAVLRRAVELGVNFIDTADAYGPEVSERLIREALHPYPAGMVIATKGGLTRAGPGSWSADCSPEHLRDACEASLVRLGLERIDLYQLHTVDPAVPYEDSIGELARLREEGKIRHIGLCNVGQSELERARALAPVVSVQNRYSVEERQSDDLVETCESDGLAFIPWFPLGAGGIEGRRGELRKIAKELDASQYQIALAWLLQRSSTMLPIPGTSSLEHLEENVVAAQLRLTDEQLGALSA